MGMPSEPDYAQRRRRWLTKFGFSADPFALYEAEAEQAHDLLPYFFVDRPYFHKIFDDPATPRPGFLFATRGAGKTATLKMVARRCYPGTPGHRALAIPYDDFGPLLSEVGDDLNRITAQTHVRAIIRALTKALPAIVPPAYWEAIPDADRPLLMSFIHDFGYPMTQAALAALIGSTPLTMNWEGLTPGEMLGELARILTRLQPPPLPGAPQQVEDHRFRSIYILVDRVDESRAGPEGALPLLLSLVRDRLLLSTPHVAFKFFLPAEIGQQLQDTIDLRLDRTPPTSIMWDAEALHQMVDRRLQYYSENTIESFGELCHSSAKQRTMTRLIETAKGSPRTLIRLCGELITEVAERSSPLIRPEDVSRAIATFQHQTDIEQTPGLLATEGGTAHEPGGLPVPTRDGLVVDVQGGQVYIDRETLEPPLTAQEFDLLRTLYLASPAVVEHETLIRAIWPEDAAMPGDEQNLRKLISRLRQHLEPDAAGRESKFVRSARGRGYYLVTS